MSEAPAKRLVELFEKASKLAGKGKEEFLERVRDEDAGLATEPDPD